MILSHLQPHAYSASTYFLRVGQSLGEAMNGSSRDRTSAKGSFTEMRHTKKRAYLLGDMRGSD